MLDMFGANFFKTQGKVMRRTISVRCSCEQQIVAQFQTRECALQNYITRDKCDARDALQPKSDTLRLKQRRAKAVS